MSRIYAVPFTGTLTAAGTDIDLFSFQPADDKPIRLRGFVLAQSSEVGDTGEEGFRITVRRMLTTFTVGSGGSAISAAPPVNDEGGTNWAFTARGGDTTVASTSGVNQILLEMAWNIRNSPCDFWWPDRDFCPSVRQSAGNATALVIRSETTVADDVVFHGTVWIEEE